MLKQKIVSSPDVAVKDLTRTESGIRVLEKFSVIYAMTVATGILSAPPKLHSWLINITHSKRRKGALELLNHYFPITFLVAISISSTLMVFLRACKA